MEQLSYAAVCSHAIDTETKQLVKPLKPVHIEFIDTPSEPPKKILTQTPISNFAHEPTNKTRSQCNRKKSNRHSPIQHHQRAEKKHNVKKHQQGRADKLKSTSPKDDNTDDIDDAYIYSLDYFDSLESISCDTYSSDSDSDTWW